jgi:alkane 1-monooxygenase
MDRLYLHSSLPYYMNSGFVFFFIFITEFYHRPFVIFLIFYGVIPLIDMVLPDDNRNPSPSEEKLLSSQLKWKIPIYVYVLAEWTCLFWSFSYVTRNELSFNQFFVLMLVVGHVSGIGFLFSHELFHKRDFLGQVVGTFNLLKTLYMHYYSDHLKGHHKDVSTPHDPATGN